MPDPVVVIGGGLAGLAAAARLAKAGHQVELYERSETLGGTWAPYRLDERCHGGRCAVDHRLPGTMA